MGGRSGTPADQSRAWCQQIAGTLADRLRQWLETRRTTSPEWEGGRFVAGDLLQQALWNGIDQDDFDVAVGEHFPGCAEELRRRLDALESECRRGPLWSEDDPLSLDGEPGGGNRVRFIMARAIVAGRYLARIAGQTESPTCDVELDKLLRESLSKNEHIVLGAVILRLRRDHRRMTKDELGMFLSDPSQLTGKLDPKTIRPVRDELLNRGLLEMKGRYIVPTEIGLRAYGPTDD